MSFERITVRDSITHYSRLIAITKRFVRDLESSTVANNELIEYYVSIIKRYKSFISYLNKYPLETTVDEKFNLKMIKSHEL